MPRPNPRTSPAKAPLSLDAVVRATLTLIDESGCDAVSMRRVAQALDTGSASLYVYVHDRRELMLLAHDLAVAAVELPTEADGDWRARLELLVQRTIAALATHRDLAALGFTEAPTGPHFLRLIEEMLRLLRQALPDPACAWAVDLLAQYIASAALESGFRAGGGSGSGLDAKPAPDSGSESDNSSRPSSGADSLSGLASNPGLLSDKGSDSRAGVNSDPGAISGSGSGSGSEEETRAYLDAVYAALPADEYPTIHALGPFLTAGGPDRATWKLRVIIDGLLATAASGPELDARW
ncbi:TetR/AcrR family transcriptional regulator [Nocardia brasiliensis]|uniref:Transcriptional regulatory protein n=1 Tax=Nocardia brasiliensis (strain ATCC 700358 / HUJEG-1) TaxID=1133849 RepID=K0F685_NOCB7|nr:TetR/AcrR family transcriptional regulator C-terminal domain-containing protein [Nocardia brasiliensis]AFU04860.1 transcriptional regulatory protein [Nocardia brasiliensis ATCC 700358]OCF88185.1 transcriptional regulator [Nocardia brasiliensis]